MRFELYLKAFLRLQKVRISKLRGIGHDFIKLGVCSQHKGLVLDSKTNDILEFLTESVAWGRARYLEVGMLAVPDIQELARAYQRLHKSVGALAAARPPVRGPSSKKALTSIIFLRQPSIERRFGIGFRSVAASRLIERNRRPIHMKERRPAA
jgi:hypothetical protein